ncbi:hypothetical protein B0H12DRAFT_472173 [Mycena haematopus]|nr:hypothetical protein B0H12DRAFT_472173 [Mycena haematopus]
MPSFFAPHEKHTKSPSRPATSLLRRFNDLYKPSATPFSSFVPKAKSGKTSQKQPKTLFNLNHDHPVRVSLFPLDTRRDSSGDFESNSSHSEASSSQQTLELLTPSSESESDASPILPCIQVRPAQGPPIKPLRPALKQTTSWNTTATRTSTQDLHVSFLIPPRSDSPDPTPTPTTFILHPLFSYIRPVEHAPISCDILYAPSLRTILDRSTRASIPYGTLAEPATQPALYEQLVLRVKCDFTNPFPWEIVVRPNDSGASPHSPAETKRFIRRRPPIPITNLDVLFALYDALSERVTEEEWARLGNRSRVQRQIRRAYERRCVKLGGGWEAGVRRIDWLDGRTRLVGIEMVHSKSKDGTDADSATLIFKTPT